MRDGDATNDIATEVAELARRAREAAYVAIGLGVLGVQRAQALRRELAPLGAQLPGPARELAERARCELEAVGSQLRRLLTPGS